MNVFIHTCDGPFALHESECVDLVHANVYAYARVYM
jgi:hypothetical protein